jgi:hypothetical protein
VQNKVLLLSDTQIVRVFAFSGDGDSGSAYGLKHGAGEMYDKLSGPLI